jgi:hypothetical protein
MVPTAAFGSVLPRRFELFPSSTGMSVSVSAVRCADITIGASKPGASGWNNRTPRPGLALPPDAPTPPAHTRYPRWGDLPVRGGGLPR